MATATNIRRTAVSQRQQQRMLLGLVMAFLALALAVITAVFYLGRGVASTVTGGPTTAVVVAAQAIPAGKAITASMLKVVQIPQNLWTSDYLNSTASLVNGTTRVQIAPGAIVMKSALDFNGQAGAGLQAGQRAVTIDVNQVTSVGDSLVAGDHVDIYASYTGKGNVAKTVVLLQDVPIIAVETNASSSSSPTSSLLPAGSAAPPKDQSVTFAVSPTDAAKLIYMDNFAKEIRVVLRSRADNGKTLSVPSQTASDF